MKSEVTTDSNWWDKFGKPQYGGEMIIRASRNIVNFDPFSNGALTTIQTAWMEKLQNVLASFPIPQGSTS
jgi:hypothetical protein